jgi:hypothetical protein
MIIFYAFFGNINKIKHLEISAKVAETLIKSSILKEFIKKQINLCIVVRKK